MREILFRGKTYDGRWVEGSYGHSTIIGEDTYVATVIYSNDTNLFTADWDEVISETVGQYTGLTDKNGKKIFEGDIIKRMWNGSLSIYQVVFDKYLAAFIGETKPYGMFTTFDGDGEWFEVIGNIHDNPELIKT